MPDVGFCAPCLPKCPTSDNKVKYTDPLFVYFLFVFVTRINAAKDRHQNVCQFCFLVSPTAQVNDGSSPSGGRDKDPPPAMSLAFQNYWGPMQVTTTTHLFCVLSLKRHQ
uniref:Uncharacterized protein n=1 Tax=Eutreptiella gymnastica TaxID=73025 RepID=A0A6U8K9A9_9EUGL|mmetsp:Transcript_69632/g.122844  ORF Transcript_69632/g.122844 Transcript_69632/m.122844 type:complete len:110 (+) Transcript_69632:731-1060(+)